MAERVRLEGLRWLPCVLPGQAHGADWSPAGEAVLRQVLQGADVAFVLAGLGGSTGSTRAPLVARLAKEAGALTVGVVCEPFTFEGLRRRRTAAAALGQLATEADLVIALPADAILLPLAKSTIAQAFEYLDGLMSGAVRAITELLTQPCLIAPDLSDLRALLAGGGIARLGIGRAEGEERARQAAGQALACPLLGSAVARAAMVLLHVRAGPDLALIEVVEAAELVHEAAPAEATVLIAANTDPDLGEAFEVMLIAAAIADTYTGDCRQPDGGGRPGVRSER